MPPPRPDRAGAKGRTRHHTVACLRGPVARRDGRLDGSGRTAPSPVPTASHHEPVTALTVADAMTTDVIPAQPAMTVNALTMPLVEHHLGALPVPADDGRLLGVAVEDRTAAEVAERMVRRVDGVVDVEAALNSYTDDGGHTRSG